MVSARSASNSIAGWDWTDASSDGGPRGRLLCPCPITSLINDDEMPLVVTTFSVRNMTIRDTYETFVRRTSRD